MVVIAAVSMLTIIYAVYLYFRGILPVVYRLGNGLAKRKVAIFAKNENLASLRHLLEDAKLFRQKTLEVSCNADAGRAEEASVYLVNWQDWGG